MGATSSPRTTGVRQFLDLEQQRDWIEGKIDLPDTSERSESLEQRFKYVARFEKLLGRPQAREVLEILGLYGPNCIPIPRRTERYYWSVSCLPSTSDKPLVRVNASWMELFTLYAHGEDIRARFIVHLSDFTTDRSATPSRCGRTLSRAKRRDARARQLFLPARCGHFRHQCAGLCLDPPIPCEPPRGARHSDVQPDAHEPGAERLSGEPLLQRG